MATAEVDIAPLTLTNTKPRRTYSDEEKARALALYDLCGSLPETSAKSGIATSTLWQWITAARDKNNKSVAKLRNQFGQSLADNFEEIALEVTSVALRKLRSKGADKIPFGQLMVGGTNAVQNMQLLRGLPTAINGEIERKDLIAILQSAMKAGLDDNVIDVTAEPVSSDQSAS